MIIKLKNDELDKTIYLIGEYHNLEKCKIVHDNNKHVMIYDFYDNLFQNNICYLDFFLETPSYLIGSKSQQQNFEIKSLSDKYTKFMQGYFKNKNTDINLNVTRELMRLKCTSKIVKCHYVDVRDDIKDDITANFDMISENPNKVFKKLKLYIYKSYCNSTPGAPLDKVLVDYFKNNSLFNNIDICSIDLSAINDNTASVLNDPKKHTCIDTFKNVNECKKLGNNMLAQYIKNNITEEQFNKYTNTLLSEQIIKLNIIKSVMETVDIDNLLNAIEGFKVNKNIDKIVNENTRQTMLDIIYNIIPVYSIIKILDRLKRHIIVASTIYKYLYVLWEYMYQVRIHIMDVYAIARILKTEKIDTDKKPYKDNIDKKNIILHCGSDHINFQKKILTEYLGFKIIEEVRGVRGESCIDLNQLNAVKIPFFLDPPIQGKYQNAVISL